MSNVISTTDTRSLVWRPLLELPQRFNLIVSLSKRELAMRYRGSVLGLVWAFVTPIVMIAIYTFIFVGIFNARFGANGSVWDYALYLFCGLLPWTAFAEALQISSTTIVAHANLVKRVVFPLETLPMAQVFAAFANQMFGTLALLIAIVIVRHEFHLTVFWLPMLIIPQLLATLGLAWFIASLGVFVRDTAQAITLVLTAALYLTPIIYPETVVPAKYQSLIALNPWTPLVRNYRRIIIEGVGIDWRGLAYFTAFALVCFILGYFWFAKTRKNFADVI
jgi:lipopolysaccharide transport system permease protein